MPASQILLLGGSCHLATSLQRPWVAAHRRWHRSIAPGFQLELEGLTSRSPYRPHLSQHLEPPAYSTKAPWLGEMLLVRHESPEGFSA